MDTKRKYYVQIDTGYINPTPTPDQPAEFEIEATYEEMLSVKELLHKRDQAGSRSAEYHFEAPFQESKTESKKEEYDIYMEKVYRRLHELGTSDTKRGIEETGILSIEDEQHK